MEFTEQDLEEMSCRHRDGWFQAHDDLKSAMLSGKSFTDEEASDLIDALVTRVLMVGMISSDLIAMKKAAIQG